MEQILSHEIVNNKLNFRIKWRGYEQPELTGLNSTLQNNEIVQKYLQINALQKFANKRKAKEMDTPEPKRVRFSSTVDLDEMRRANY